MTVVRSIRRVGVVGAASQVGRALLPRLAAQGIRVCRIGRKTGLGGAKQVHVYDADRGCFEPPIDAAQALVSLAPLPTIGVVLDMARLLGARRVIAFGSTGRFSKVSSSSTLELDFVNQQEQAERLFSTRCGQAGVAWTLFRPTMIYGAHADQSVAFVKAMVARFGFFPIPWGATGLRQPVHLDDLAAACVSALECERTFGRAYNLGAGKSCVSRIWCGAFSTRCTGGRCWFRCRYRCITCSSLRPASSPGPRSCAGKWSTGCTRTWSQTINRRGKISATPREDSP